jgi:tetratricopeptide (TPR) repeat protein
MTMNRFKQVVLNGSKALIVGLSLAVMPWLGSLYLCSGTPDRELEVNSFLTLNQSLTKASQPHLLPVGGSVRCLLTSDSQDQPILSADFPEEQSDSIDLSNDGPMLTDPVQAEKSQSAYIPYSGIVAENTFDEFSCDSSSPIWMPVEIPLVEKKAESSPEPKTTEVVANSDRSAESTPAVTSAAVDNQSEAPVTDQEIIYPSTEPLLTKRAAAKDFPVRSEQLESIARQADQQTRHGFELAGRGAYLAARSEFINALRLVAQGLDTDGQTKIHGKSLAAGLTALKEVEDFIPSGSKIEADLDIPDIIAGHTTPVLKDADKSSLTSLTAMKSYLTFAQEQLAQSAGNEVAGSMALHAMGKLHEELAKKKDTTIKAVAPKAMAFYQASLLVYPQNFMAANDLGVMLARNGNYDDARKMLEHSVAINQQSTVWHNLAMVYERLGRGNQARQAQQQASIVMQMEQANRQKKLVSAGNQVRWVDENTFAQKSNSSGISQGMASSRTAANTTRNTTMQQQSGSSLPQQQNAMQPVKNQYWSANANAVQMQPNISRPLPVMRPAATGSLPPNSYDARR